MLSCCVLVLCLLVSLFFLSGLRFSVVRLVLCFGVVVTCCVFVFCFRVEIGCRALVLCFSVVF